MTTTPDKTPSPQVPLAPRKNFLSRFLALPERWRWGLVVVGLLLAVGGSILIYSTTSQLATYQSVRGTILSFNGTFSASGVGEGDVSFENGATYHIRGKDYSPHVDLLKDLAGNDVEFIYRPDNRVVQITVFGGNTPAVGYSKHLEVFTSSEYARITQNRTIGIAALIAGLVLAAFAFVVPIIRGRFGEK